jgi:ABC-2 type transport system ATP-binding protein
MNAIEIRGLTKEFDELKAVDSVDLTIKEGEIFGLLGPNGAGKSTTIFMLSTILNPTRGNAKVCGHDIVKERDAVRHCIGIVFQDPSLDDDLTARENLYFHGRLYGMAEEEIGAKSQEVLALVELMDRKDSLVKTFSGGMKRRLEIARGLMHHPKVLFLDEPTLGLDPQTRRHLWDYIKKINQNEKMTIILTTHYMDEADFLCDRIGIIDKGRIIALDTAERLKDVLGGDVITLQVSDSGKMKVLLEKLECEKCVKKVDVFDNSLNVTITDGGKNIPKIVRLAEKNKITIDSVMLKRPSLEDVFIHYTGRTIREEEPAKRRWRGGPHGR